MRGSVFRLAQLADSLAWTPRPLLWGNRFDNHPARLLRVKLLRRPLQRLPHQVQHRGIIERGGILQYSVAHFAPAAPQIALRIVQLRSTDQEEQAHPSRKESNRKDCIRSPLRGAESDR